MLRRWARKRAARGWVAKDSMAPDGSEIIYSHETRVDSKDVQSHSALVIKNSACSLFYKEEFRTSFLDNKIFLFSSACVKAVIRSLCNKVQYLVIFDKSLICISMCRYVSKQTYCRYTIHIHNIYYL